MIFPEPRPDRLNQRGIAFFSTILLALILYGVLRFSGITMNDNRVSLREINLDGLLASRVHMAAARAEVTGNTLTMLMEGPSSEQLSTEQGESFDSSEEGARVNSGNNSTPDIEDSEAPEKQITADPEPEKTPRETVRNPPSTSSTVNVPAGESVSQGEESIKRIALAAFGDDYKSLDIRAIIDWMKQNPGDLPKGIRQLVRFRPAFLSSVTAFNMDGKDYELYLMCKESLYEVHVVLVDDKEAIYLVDRSFQKLSTYLRKGQVRRTEDQHIVAVRSNMASNASSDEFYTLFLSWWDWAEKES